MIRFPPTTTTVCAPYGFFAWSFPTFRFGWRLRRPVGGRPSPLGDTGDPMDKRANASHTRVHGCIRGRPVYESTRYEIVVLDPQVSGLRQILEPAIRREVSNLGIDPDASLRFLGADGVESLRTRDHVVGVYRGGPRQDAACTGAAERLGTAGISILPLVEDLQDYPKSVPSVLRPINGMQIDKADSQMDAAVSRILEMLRLQRDQRRLFISYRRTESREVALQLYHVLQERRFDVFLDTHGVQTGDRFQDELGQRLLDADVMIFLDTTGALASEWIRHEIEIANALAIGVLQVVFPRPPAPAGGLDRARFSELCEPFELAGRHFLGRDFGRDGRERLAPDVLTSIALRVEGLRARSMAARQSRLTARLLAALEDLPAGRQTPYQVEPGRHITIQRRTGPCRVFPRIGVVDSRSLHRAEMDAEKLPVAVLYDPTGLRPDSQAHLDWLCRYAGIVPISLLETERWVSG